MRPVIAFAFLAGCFSPSFTDGKTPCQSDSQCPPGFHCAVTQSCWHDGRDPDLDMGQPDLATSEDLAGADFAGSDLSAPPDLRQAPDLQPLTFPPASVWTCGGGGSGVGNGTGAELNFSIGDSIVMGTSVAPSGATVTFSYFSDDIY